MWNDLFYQKLYRSLPNADFVREIEFLEKLFVLSGEYDTQSLDDEIMDLRQFAAEECFERFPQLIKDFPVIAEWRPLRKKLNAGCPLGGVDEKI